MFEYPLQLYLYAFARLIDSMERFCVVLQVTSGEELIDYIGQ